MKCSFSVVSQGKVLQNVIRYKSHAIAFSIEQGIHLFMLRFTILSCSKQNKSREICQVCSSAACRALKHGKRQRQRQKGKETEKECSENSCILYYKYVLHVKQNQETNVSPQRVKT